MDKLKPPRQPRDKMDRLIQEAQKEGLFYGRLKHTLMVGYEGHQQSKWMQHAATAMIFGVLIGLVTTWMGWPVPIVVALFGVCLLAAVICVGIGMFHLVRYLWLQAQPDERSAVVEDAHLEAKQPGAIDSDDASTDVRDSRNK